MGQVDQVKYLDGYVAPSRLLDISVLLRTKFPVPRSFVRMRFPCEGKICGEDKMKDENAMQLDARVTNFLTKTSLTRYLAISTLVKYWRFLIES